MPVPTRAATPHVKAPPLVLSGRLEAIGLGDVLQILSASEHSGVLSVEREDPLERGEIELAAGRVVRAEISGGPEPLGTMLLRRGTLDPKALGMALRRQAASAAWKPLGTVLMEMGAVQPGDLGEALVEQMGACASEMLRWERGLFSFRRRDPRRSPASPSMMRVALDTQEILLDAARRYDESTQS